MSVLVLLIAATSRLAPRMATPHASALQISPAISRPARLAPRSIAQDAVLPRFQRLSCPAPRMAVSSSPSEKPFWTAAKLHDYFNIAFCASMTALTVAAPFKAACNLPLAIMMAVYLVADSVWIAARPDFVTADNVDEGGGATTLLIHHAMALVVAMHAVTWTLHTRYTCWLTVLETNTLILMFKKSWSGGAGVQAFLDKLFVASWVVTRLLWFPFVAVYLSAVDGYPSLLRRVLCALTLNGLTVLQGLWTWNFCVPPEKQIALP